MSEIIEVTPELEASPVKALEFTDSTQSVELLLAAAAPPDKTATSLRLFAFQPDGNVERIAFVFVGPQAEDLSLMFVRYAEALFNELDSRARQEKSE